MRLISRVLIGIAGGAAAIGAAGLGLLKYERPLLAREAGPVLKAIEHVIPGRTALAHESEIAAAGKTAHTEAFPAARIEGIRPATIEATPPARISGAQSLEALRPSDAALQDTNKAASLLRGLPHHAATEVAHTLYATYDSAVVPIITRLGSEQIGLTQQRIVIVVGEELGNGLTQAVAKAPSLFTFEIFTGKLQLAHTGQLLGINFTAGSINVYKVALPSAIAIYACHELATNEFAHCVSDALKKMRAEVVHEIAAGLAPEKPSKEQ